jgi:predicted alpha/beta hydrolase
MNYDSRLRSVAADVPATEDVRIVADDDRELAATWFRPVGRPRGGVVVVPAMGVPSSYYAEFASWLAGEGFLVLTFDYRGTGVPARLRAEQGDLVRWAGDAASALEALEQEGRRLTGDRLALTWIGHSLGGQVLPFARHDLLDHAVLVATGSGYWRLGVRRTRWIAPLLWKVIAPTAIRLAGYYPGTRLHLLADLPPQVMRQWGRWCMSESYFGVDVPRMPERLSEVTVPISSLSFEDDELLSAASTEALIDLYTAADRIRERYSPADLGAERIGHHGFFRPRHRPAWVTVVLPRVAANG